MVNKKSQLGFLEVVFLVILVALAWLFGYGITICYLYLTNINWHYAGPDLWTIVFGLFVGAVLILLYLAKQEKIFKNISLLFFFLTLCMPIILTQLAQLYFYLLLPHTANALLAWRYWSIPIVGVFVKLILSLSWSEKRQPTG